MDTCFLARMLIVYETIKIIISTTSAYYNLFRSIHF